jgi:hypothetical protein
MQAPIVTGVLCKVSGCLCRYKCLLDRTVGFSPGQQAPVVLVVCTAFPRKKKKKKKKQIGGG